MRDEAKVKYVLAETERVFRETMRKLEENLMNEPDTDEAIGEVLAIVAGGFRDFEIALAQYLVEGKPF